MVTRFIEAIEKATGLVRDTEVITNDNLNEFDIPDIFPNLSPGLYNFRAVSELTPDYEVLQPAPVIPGVPTISGTVRTGQTQTANPSPPTGDPIPTRTWQWQRLVSGTWTNISGATASTYVITAADEGFSIRAVQTETNVNGTASANSDPLAVPFLLDQLTATAAFAISGRKLRGAYTGAAWQHRRSNDNATQDQAFGSDFRVDTAALATFVGSNSAFVATAYDQSGNARNVTAPSTARQPRIRNAGTNDTLSGKVAPFFSFSGTTNVLQNSTPFMQAAGAASIFVVQDCAAELGRVLVRERNTAGSAAYGLTTGITGNTDAMGVLGRNDANTAYMNPTQAQDNAFTGVPTVVAMRDSGTTLETFRNGPRGFNGTYTRSGVSTLNQFSIGGIDSAGTGVTGRIAEIIIFTTAISNEDLNTIIASQGGEYGISVSPFLTEEEAEFAGLPRDGIFAKTSDNWEGYTATISRNDSGWGGVGFPFLHRWRFRNTTGGANRVTAPPSELNSFNTYKMEYFTGGNVRIFRPTNGVLAQVRESTITGGKIGQWNWNKRNEDMALSGLTLRDLLSNSSDTSGRPYYYRVAAVGSDGLIGAWSTVVSYTPANLNGSTAVVHPPLATVLRRGAGGALAAPTGVTVVAGTIAREAVISWNAVAGASGYVVERAFDSPTTWTWVKQNPDRVFTGTTHRFVFSTFNGANAPYWFRVAAVGSDGLSGAWSDPASFTPTSTGAGTPSGIVTPVGTVVRTGSGGALAAPTGVSTAEGAAPREVVITWNAVAGASGYIVEFSFYDPATEIDTSEYFELSSHGTPTLPGDLVIIEKQFLTLDDTLFSPRVFGASMGEARRPPVMWFDAQVLKRDGRDWAYVAYSGDKPPGAVGDHFFRRTAFAGQTALLQRFWHGGTAQGAYKILDPTKTYRMRCVIRASSPVTVTWGPGQVPGVTVPATFDNVPSTWTEYTFDFQPTSQLTDSTPRAWTMQFTAGASTVNLDLAFFQITELGTPLATSADTPAPAGAYLRDHSFIKPGTNNRSMLRLVTGANYSFKGFYDILIEQGALPWFQFEWNVTKDELLNFVAYLAAPNGTHPYADLRQASGIPEPWTTIFSKIRLELGNEAWNNFSGFWTFPGSMVDSATGQVYSGGPSNNQGEVAGLFWQMMSGWMQESPYWSTLAPKLTQHLGGATAGSFGSQAFRFYRDAKEVSTAPYNGGWEGGSSLVQETGFSFNVLLSDTLTVQKPRALARVSELRSVCAQIDKTYGVDVRPDVYEAGPGYQLDGTAAQNIVQEAVMKSRASATATVDTMLQLAQQGFKSWNFFVLGSGNRWAAYAPPVDGGHEYVVHALPRIIHEQMAPCDVWGALTAPLGLKTGEINNGTTSQINQIGAYQLRNLANPSKRMIVLVNRNIDPSQLDPTDPRYSATPSGTVAFNVTTAWTGATSLRAWTAGIGPYRQHNRYPAGFRRDTASNLVADPLCVSFDYSPTTLSLPANLQNFPINASVGATAAGLPAGNCLILLFEGVTGG